jgi:hypothetical protein
MSGVRPGIERDPYLAPVCARWGEGAAEEAGWFDDGDPSAALDDVDWLCTPTGPIPSPGGGRPVVLLSTGGFYPVHAGHLAMMDAARAAIEAEGRTVVGGYLSPAHDGYIAHKCGGVPHPVSTRLAAAAAAVDGSWLAIDPWEALGRRVAVNYTDVTARLEAYLRHHVEPTIDVVYVCGGDNARFALAFTERGGCVVVGRPGTEAEVDRWRADPRVAGNPRIRWVGGAESSSSSTLRAATARSGPAAAAPRLTLRLEDTRAVAALGLAPETWARFQDGLVAELAGLLDVRTATIDGQARRLAAAGHPPLPTISLDPLLPGDADLGVSRRFELGGLQQRGHVARPGWPPLAEQVAGVPPGPWQLRDDDRVTGATIAFVRQLLAPGVDLQRTTIALEPEAGFDPDAGAEVADSRDFLLGTDDGGLVVALPGGTVGRAPYLLPYVDPSVRAGLPGDRALAFSAAVWHLAAAAFAGTGLRVADVPAPAGRTLAAAGYAADALLADVCADHGAHLTDLLRR